MSAICSDSDPLALLLLLLLKWFRIKTLEAPLSSVHTQQDTVKPKAERVEEQEFNDFGDIAPSNIKVFILHFQSFIIFQQ